MYDITSLGKFVICIHAAIINCFTVTESFNNARKWLTELRDHSDSNIVVLLAGNKNDLSHLRAVSIEQAHEFANSEGKSKPKVHRILLQAFFLGLTTIETSALNSSNVEQAFTDLLSMTYTVMCKVRSTSYLILSFTPETSLI